MSDRFLVQLIDGGTVTERIRVYATSGVGVVETNAIVSVALGEAKAYTDTEVGELADSTSAAIAAHATDTTGVHGIPDTALLETQAGAQGKATAALDAANDYTDTRVDTLAGNTSAAITAHATDTTDVHGIADTGELTTTPELNAAITGAIGTANAYTDAHAEDTTAVHGIADTTVLVTDTELAAHATDTTDVHGITDTTLIATTTDLEDYAKLHEPNVFDVAGGSIPVLAWDDTGVAWFGEVEEGKDFSDGGQMRSMGLIIRPHISGEHPGRVYAPSGLNVFAPGDPPELAGVIAGGTLASGKVAAAQLVLGVPDVTTLVNGELFLDAGYDPGTQWPVTAPEIDEDGDLEGVRDRKVQLQDGAFHVANLTYTGRNDAERKLTGVAYVSHTGSATFNSVVTRVYRYVGKGGTGLAVLGLADMGAGTQVRMANLSFIADEDQTFDGYGHYNAGGAIQFAPSTLGPWSMRKRRALWGARGDLWFYGSQARQPSTEVDRHRRLVVSQENTMTRGAQTIPVTPTTPYTIAVRDPAGLPVPGAGGWPTPLYLQVATLVPVGTIEVAYTGYAATNGQWFLTGCTSDMSTAGASLSASANIDLARRNLGPVIGAKGNVVAYDLQSPQDKGRLESGAVGPTGEGGIQAGIVDGGEVGLYQAAPGVWAMGVDDRLRGQGSTGPAPLFAARRSTDTVANRWEVRANGEQWIGAGTIAADLVMKRNNPSELLITDAAGAAGAGIVTAGQHKFVELAADPAAPSVNQALLYTKDNGSGKTQLCVRFNTGAVAVLATQP